MAKVRRPAGVSAEDWGRLLDLAEEFRDAQQRIHDGLEHLPGSAEPNESACDLAALFVRAVLAGGEDR
jgi:hypothetical protein